MKNVEAIVFWSKLSSFPPYFQHIKDKMYSLSMFHILIIMMSMMLMSSLINMMEVNGIGMLSYI